jgi:iron complex outermembrane recepter protein
MLLRSMRWRPAAIAGTAVLLGTVAAPALAQQGAVEEVVVTGSYIKRTTADSPSPLTVIDRTQIEQIGAIEVADIVNRMTFNSGSTNTTSAFSGGDNSTGQTNINLRNLGLGSTLVLINGKRYVRTNTDSGGNAYVNTSTLIPSIAIERVEVVKDGASALYGSDAVAGVVNFITRTGFDGAEISFDARTDQETKKQDDFTFSGIWGVSSDRGSITASAEFLERKALTIDDRFKDYGGTGVSTLANPGSFAPIAVPGSPGATTVTPAFIVGGGGLGDLDCELAAGQHRQSFRSPLTGTPLAGSSLEANGGCIYDFSPFFSLVGAETRFLSHVAGEYEITDTMQVYGEMSFADQKFSRHNSMFPLVRFPVLPGNHPGLLNDLARRDANLAAAGSPLAGVLTTPGNVGGAIFFGRPLGFTPADTGSDIRPIDTDTREFGNTYRAILGMRGDLAIGSGWSYDTSFTRSERNQTTRGTDTIQQNLQLAIRGLGGANCNAATGTPGSGNAGSTTAGNECYWYNPFFSGFFAPDGSTQTDAALANPVSLYNWMIGEFRTGSEQTQLVWDFVTTGDLFTMGNGQTVGMAFGLQWRRDETSLEVDDTSNAGGFSFIFGGTNWDAKETTTAAFLEFAIPVTDTLEFQLAGRYERFEEIDDDTFDPKLTAMWRATDDLTLRASTGTSFRIPSLLQSGGFSTQLINIADPFSGASLAFRPEIAQGNPNLAPESAFVWNLGLSWAPSEGALEGLGVDLDYYSYDYEDLIARPGAASLIAQDIASRCPQGLNNLNVEDPDLTRPACGTQGLGGIAFDPAGGPGLPDQVIRDESGNYLRAEPRFTNAQELQTSGLDANIRYQWSTDSLGIFTAGAAASWTRDYKITDINGNKFDGAGKRNIGTTIGRSLPQWKANFSLGWMLDRHSAFALVRYIDSYKDDQPIQRDGLNSPTGNPVCVGSCLRAVSFGITDLLNDKVDSWTTLDLQYSYDLPAWGLQSEGSRITIGGVNVTNKTPPKLNFDGGFDPFVHDARGAMWYARYTIQL